MVIVFFSILNQMELYLLQNLNENGHHDHIPFDLKENENLILWVGKLQQTNEKITSPRQHGQFFFFSTLFLKKNLWNGISRHHGGSQKPCSTSQHCGIELLNDGPSIGPPLCRETLQSLGQPRRLFLVWLLAYFPELIIKQYRVICNVVVPVVGEKPLEH